MCAFQIEYRSLEAKLGNVDPADSPGLATITGLHISSNPFTLGHSVDVVGVRSVEGNLGVDPS